MTRRLNSILSKPDAARLRKVFGCEADEFAFLVGHLSTSIEGFERYGILDLETCFGLTEAQMASTHLVEIEGYLNNFLVVSVSKKLTTALKAGAAILNDDLDHLRLPSINSSGDLYLKDFDDLGDIAEEQPIYAGAQPYEHWGSICFLMTEQRLRQELLEGDPLRLLHRTPYRPMT